MTAALKGKGRSRVCSHAGSEPFPSGFSPGTLVAGEEDRKMDVYNQNDDN